MAIFDAYGMVDWSAAATPRLGADSIWMALSDRSGCRLLENHATRHGAMARLVGILEDPAWKHRRIVLGFDFPFGYPRGTAERIGLRGVPWRALWRYFAEHLEDDARNANNRFSVASQLNQIISGRPFPFWGHPHRHRYDCLGPRKPRGYGDGGLPERRHIDSRVPRAKAVWQLAYNGSVGSQAMLGLKHLWALRHRDDLRDRITIWPFETGLVEPTDVWKPIVLAEIYPSLLRPADLPDKPLDARQVVAVVEAIRRLDQADRLAPLFRGPMSVDTATRLVVETEEAWILGVTDSGTFAEIPGQPAQSAQGGSGL